MTEAQRAAQRRYRQRHPEKYLEMQRNWRNKNRAHYRNYHAKRAFRLYHVDLDFNARKKLANAKWRAKNPDRIAWHNEQYRQRRALAVESVKEWSVYEHNNYRSAYQQW